MLYRRFIKRLFLTVLCLTFLSGCAQSTAPAPTPLPTPKSKRINEFFWQRDGDYAYSMLRPTNWAAADDGGGRVYYPNPQDNQMRLSLSAVNLNIYQDRANGSSTDVRLALFREHPDLEGWTDALVQTLHKNDAVQLEHSLANARIYSVRSLKFGGHIQLVAYAIDKTMPLEITLNVGGDNALMEEIYQAGLMDDFIAIVESVRAAPEEPGFSSPPLIGK